MTACPAQSVTLTAYDRGGNQITTTTASAQSNTLTPMTVSAPGAAATTAYLTIGPGAFSGGDWFAFTDLSYGPVSGYQHVVYQSGDGHLRELFYPLGGTGNVWQTTDLTAATGARTANYYCPLTSWADPYNQHVAYETADGHVHELYYPIGGTGPLWQTTDLTAATGAPPAASPRAST